MSINYSCSLTLLFLYRVSPLDCSLRLCQWSPQNLSSACPQTENKGEGAWTRTHRAHPHTANKTDHSCKLHSEQPSGINTLTSKEIECEKFKWWQVNLRAWMLIRENCKTTEIHTRWVQCRSLRVSGGVCIGGSGVFLVRVCMRPLEGRGNTVKQWYNVKLPIIFLPLEHWVCRKKQYTVKVCSCVLLRGAASWKLHLKN